MLRNRVIPCLLYSDEGLVKTKQFKNPNYIGDPINSLKLFNDKEVDELILLDIDASSRNQEPNYELIEQVASECFMPLCYGGGINTVDQMKKIFSLGVEKVSLNSHVFKSYDLIREAAKAFGNQSVVVSIDVKKNLFGKYRVFNHLTQKTLNIPLDKYLKDIQASGAGEILINNVDRDGLMNGYDHNLINLVSKQVSVPHIFMGGSKDYDSLKTTFKLPNVTALAAGSIFVYTGKYNAVLINYPTQEELEKIIIND